MRRSPYLSSICGAIGPPPSVPLSLVLSWSILLAAIGAADENVDDLERGERLFHKQCATCHGSQGEGVADHYPDPLEGDYAREHLLEIIEQTMPEDDPEACVEQEAADVAAFVYDAFYSPTSRRARQDARVELVRLTVPQYRNSITDLFHALASHAAPRVEDNGLQAIYYKSRRLQSDDEVLERVDSTIDFDFKEGTPEPEDEFEADEFAIAWEGGLKVNRTGLYRIHLRSENGTKVWLNDLETPLIDAWVRSGDVTEEETSIFLLGGRVYPLKVHFFKNNDDRASISLRWQPPHGVEEVIPAQYFVHGRFPRQFVVTADFPPDDRSRGYERGSSASRAWADATTDGAIETANAVLSRLDELASVEDQHSAKKRRRKLRKFCHRFVELAFRQPLNEEQRQAYVDSQFEEAETVQQAVKRVVILVLKSPRFLYPDPDPTSGDDYAVASRLAYALWDSLPDQQLLKAAKAGKLQSEDEVSQQAERMLQDPRARAKLRNFFRYWLDLDADHDLAKDESRYPGFDSRLVVDLERSLEGFVEETVWSEQSDFRQLLVEESLLLDPRLADFYGVSCPDEGIASLELEQTPRAGVLTHPYIMAALAHRQASSPIHRGVFLLRTILGRTLRSPPEAIELVDASVHPEMTTRQRVEVQTKPESCQKCHALINPLGFAFENYDAVGRFREEDNSQPVDAAGEYQAVDGDRLPFESARELAETLANRPEVHRAFVEQMFVYLAKQPLWAYGPEAGDALQERFERSEFHIRQLAMHAATRAALGPMQP